MKKAPTNRDDVIVLAPTGKNKTFSIATRRIGTQDRFSVVATCQSDTLAQRIVEGLKVLQGEEVKLTVPAEKLLEHARAALGSARAEADNYRTKLSAAEQTAREKGYEIDRMRRELEGAIRERDAAQKKAREEA